MRFSALGMALPAIFILACGGADDSASDSRAEQLIEPGAPSYPAPPPAVMERSERAVAGGSGSAAKATPAAFTGSAQGPAPLPGMAGSAQQPGSTAPSMIMRTGQASVEVDSLEPAVANVQALALRVGGYVANISMHTGRAQLRQATLEVKVPAARFDDALEGLEPIGKLEALEVSAQDVGEEFADVTARVSNAKRLEQRLLTLLATRTGRLEDILAAERELARVREEIERYEGRLRFLEARVTLSTLHVTVHEPAPILGRNARNPIVDAFREAWRNFVAFVAGLIELMGILIPLAVIVLGIALAWRRWGPRFGKARAEGGTA